VTPITLERAAYAPESVAGVYAAAADDVVVEMSRSGRLLVPMRPTIQAIEGWLFVEQTVEDTWVRIDFDAMSFTTGWARADRALRGQTGLDVANYGLIRFESAGWVRLREDRFSVTGDVYLRDISLPITMDVRLVKGDRDSMRFVARATVSGRELCQSLDAAPAVGWMRPIDRIAVLAGIRFTRTDAEDRS